MALEPNILFQAQPQNTFGTAASGFESGTQTKTMIEQLQQNRNWNTPDYYNQHNNNNYNYDNYNNDNKNNT